MEAEPRKKSSRGGGRSHGAHAGGAAGDDDPDARVSREGALHHGRDWTRSKEARREGERQHEGRRRRSFLLPLSFGLFFFFFFFLPLLQFFTFSAPSPSNRDPDCLPPLPLSAAAHSYAPHGCRSPLHGARAKDPLDCSFCGAQQVLLCVTLFFVRSSTLFLNCDLALPGALFSPDARPRGQEETRVDPW